MLTNPFTPIFGGKPDFFFGRKNVLKRFQRALIDRGSEDRALFITGTRGSGKTALVEQLSQRARLRNWFTIDLGAERLTQTLLRRLIAHNEQTKTVSPQASISILGSGGSVSAGSTSKTFRYTAEDLQYVFLKACEDHSKGLFVSIDEVQKVPLDEVAAVCEAFQMASRKGYNVILVLAGLPYAYDRIIHHEGCTFMRRGVREHVGLFSWEDTAAAFGDAFGSVEGLKVNRGVIEQLSSSSMGHPYLIQLHGYYLISTINDQTDDRHYEVTHKDAQNVLPLAIDAYERRALRPMVDELNRLEQDYLRAMARNLDDNRIAWTNKIAQTLNKQQKQLSRTREALIGAGIILAPARGQVMFNVPYLADYVLEPQQVDEEVNLAKSWRL